MRKMQKTRLFIIATNEFFYIAIVTLYLVFVLEQGCSVLRISV